MSSQVEEKHGVALLHRRHTLENNSDLGVGKGADTQAGVRGVQRCTYTQTQQDGNMFPCVCFVACYLECQE